MDSLYMHPWLGITALDSTENAHVLGLMQLLPPSYQ